MRAFSRLSAATRTKSASFSHGTKFGAFCGISSAACVMTWSMATEVEAKDASSDDDLASNVKGLYDNQAFLRMSTLLKQPLPPDPCMSPDWHGEEGCHRCN